MYETSSCDIISTSERFGYFLEKSNSLNFSEFCRCFGLRLFLNIGLFIAIYTMPTLVLERYLALRQVATYQKNRTAWTWLVMFQVCGQDIVNNEAKV